MHRRITNQMGGFIALLFAVVLVADEPARLRVAEFQGILPGRATADELTNHGKWKAAYVGERKQGAYIVREYRFQPWKSVLVVLHEEKVSALEFIPPAGLQATPQQLAQVMHLGTLTPCEELPAEARFTLGEKPAPVLLASQSHHALFFVEKGDDDTTRVARIRLFGSPASHSEPKMTGTRNPSDSATSEADAQKQFTLHREKAEQGDASAMFSLGLDYAKGRGVERDDAEAVRWYRAAAEKEHAAAMNNLGVMYTGGRGVPKNEAEAVRWYRASAKLGNKTAQKNLKKRGLTW